MQGISAVAGATGGGIAAQPSPDAPDQGSGQAALGARGGGVASTGGGGGALAGATGAATIGDLVPQLQALVGKLQELVQSLQSGATSGGGGAGGGRCGMSGCGGGSASGGGAAPRGGAVEPYGGAGGAPAADVSEAQDAGAGRGTKGPGHDAAAGGPEDAKQGAADVQSAGAAGPIDKARAAKWVSGDVEGLDPVLLDRLGQLGERLGKKVDVKSGNRTRAEQEVLYAKYKAGKGNLAAKPGTSNHEGGRAADAYVSGTALRDDKAAGRIAAELGLAFPVSSESWHTELAK